MTQERLGNYVITWKALHSEMEVRTLSGTLVFDTSKKFIHETLSTDLISRFDVYHHKNRKSYVFENAQ